MEAEDKEKPLTVDDLGVKVLPAVIAAEGASMPPIPGFAARKVLTDSGIDEPGYMWLTPNGQTGWFVLDLKDIIPVSGFVIRNTMHGRFRDRWTTEFKIEASNDNSSWSSASGGTLKDNTDLMYAGSSVRSMRYVKFTMLKYGGRSGGLNYFAAVTREVPKIDVGSGKTDVAGEAAADVDDSASGKEESKKKGKKSKKKEKKDKKKKKGKKKGKKKKKSSSSSSSKASSSGSSSSEEKKAKAKKSKKARDSSDEEKGENKKAKTEAGNKETAAPAGPNFALVHEKLDKFDLSVLDQAVSLLSSGAPDQQAAIAGDLARLTPSSVDTTGSNRVAVARAGAIPPLLQLLSCTNAETQREAARALHNLTSKNADNKEGVIRHGGAAPLVAVLRGGGPEAKAQAVGLLRNLAGGSAACKDSLFKAGAIARIVAMMQEEKVPQILVNLAVALFNLCKDSPERKAKALDADAFPALVSMLGSGTPQVQQEAADTIRIIVVGSAERCMLAIGAGVAPVLAAAVSAKAPAKLQAQAGLLKTELLKSGGPEVKKALE
eukprot:TRINITY_DN26116_c0_g4_i1.p1 TRINITY_DN26116_c0_g4~~TRINITY_DN26116_c0_g4_i1.p1  ORF type:complete len:548 (+),score=154.00 TRINITY_DN26116_c0_g4_i1:85-1728(+)